MTPEEYKQRAQMIWRDFVPESGQASSAQGELLRAVAKLRDEAQRNANANFNASCHQLLVEFLRAKLLDTTIFDESSVARIEADLDKLGWKDHPYLDDDIYDRLTERVVDWCEQNAEAVPHEHNPDLSC